MTVHSTNPDTELPRCAYSPWDRGWFRIFGFRSVERDDEGRVTQHVTCERCAKDLLRRLLELSPEQRAQVLG